MIVDKLKGVGTISYMLQDADGNVKVKGEFENLTVNLGIAHVTSRLLNASEDVVTHMAIGSGNTAAAGANTALVTETARVAMASSTQVTTTVANDSVQYTASFGPGVGTGNVYEAGLFNAASGGVMTNRVVFGLVTKEAGDTFTIVWKKAFS